MHLLILSAIVIGNIGKTTSLKSFICDFDQICNKERQLICEDVNVDDCFKFDFDPNENQNSLGHERIERRNGSFRFSFDLITWKYLHVRFDDTCKKFVNEGFLHQMNFTCSTDKLFEQLFEYQAYRDLTLRSRKLVFNTSPQEMFSYIDFTDTHRIVLNVQARPTMATYKVEVWRQIDNETELLATKLIGSDNVVNGQVAFEYSTYNVEGDYFFVVSFRGEGCSFDFCAKTVTSAIHIARKRPVLIIGIVGASFIIPFVLFVVHVVTRKYRSRPDGILQTNKQILMVYESTSQTMIDIVTCLSKLLKNLLHAEIDFDLITNKHVCSDLLLSADHIVCINCPNFDYKSARELVPKTEIIDITFELTPATCLADKRFKLMDEFDEFIAEFGDTEVNYENNALYSELKTKIKTLKSDFQHIPKILITNSSMEENPDLLIP